MIVVREVALVLGNVGVDRSDPPPPAMELLRIPTQADVRLSTSLYGVSYAWRLARRTSWCSTSSRLRRDGRQPG